MVPAAYLTLNLVRKSIFDQNVERFVGKELAWQGTKIISQEVQPKDKQLRVALIGRPVEAEKIAMAESRMADYHLGEYHLSVIQGSQPDSLMRLVGQLQLSKADYTETALQQNQLIRELEVALNRYESIASLSEQLRPELQVLYPHIQSLSLARTQEVRTDTVLTTPVVVAIVRTHPRSTLSDEQVRQLAAWLKARAVADSLRVVVE